MLPLSVLRHPSVTTLHAAVRWVLVALAAQYTGRNNGALTLTRAAAREYGIASSDTLNRGLTELERRGLVMRTDPGSYMPPRPARFALTWRPLDDTDYSCANKIPSFDYRGWTHAE